MFDWMDEAQTNILCELDLLQTFILVQMHISVEETHADARNLYARD